jgi:hypothetical protein
MSSTTKRGEFPRSAPPSQPAPAPGTAKIPTTAVIFVHGIGSQKPGDTLLQWASPIIEVLTAWKVWAVPDAPNRDPVDVAQIDFENGRPRIELDIPAVTVRGRAFERQRWILTEAWWAAKVEPPSLSTMTSWLGPQGGGSQVVDAILGNRTDGGGLARIARGFVTPFVSVLVAFVMTFYALLRGISLLIPIEAIKIAAILSTFDNFLTGWFGDVRILIFDPAQSANIRAGLAAAIRGFHEEGVDRVIVMAHSGGAMVSYLTLADPAYRDARVDKLITFGEGFNLAMILTPGRRGMFDRLRTDITAPGQRPEIRWRDFWGSHDPAPAGMVRATEVGPIDPSTNRRLGAANPDHIRSREVWNRRSLLDDHGSYFDNDEEFTMAILREIDRPDGWGETPAGEPPVSRFYPTPPLNDDARQPPADPRERRHRERVAILALMRQLAIATAVGTITAVLADPRRLSDLGRGLGELLAAIPIVHDIGTAVVGFMEKVDLPLVTIERLPFGLAPFSLDADRWIDPLGLATLQAIVLISILQLWFAPVRAYEAWPASDIRRGLFQATEIAIAIGLAGSVIWLAIAPGHGRLLGAGLQEWIPGIVLTGVTLVVGFGGTRLAQWIPSATRLYAAVAMVAFVAAIASAVIVIFRRPGLEHGELGYIVIWGAFLILYRLGHDRWSQWDRVERRAAYQESPDVITRRFPVWLSMTGFVLAGIAVVLWILPELTAPTIVIGGLAGLMIVVAMLVGARMWSDEGNPITDLSSVDSARGKV